MSASKLKYISIKNENIIHLAPEGRYLCCPVCSLPWGVSILNILAIPKAIEKYGH